MAEYIERNALIAEFKRLTLGENSLVERLFADGVYAVIETFPAADVAEVRHGHWSGEIDDRDGHIWMECSECHKIRIVDDFCGACGARMDKEDEP